ncbi:MAG: rod shape-determining protein RodA [Candidatus Shapirobacteria bacterium]
MFAFKFDLWLWLAQLGLVIFGLTIIGSVAPGLFWPQLVFVVMGGVGSFILARLDYRIYAKTAPFLYLLSILLLLLPVFLGFSVHGSTRWLRIGWFNFQPSEIVKPLLVLFFAGYFGEQELFSLKRVAVGALLLLLPVWLVFNQPDLGSSLVLIFLWLGIVFAGGISRWWLVGSGALLAALLPFLRHFLKDYQKERLASFLRPQNDPLGAGYHLLQSKVAIGSGQLFGRGLGRGTQSHLRFLPERQTDFIFASLAEEVGFLGSLGVLGFFALVLYRLLRISERSRDRSGRLIGAGIFSWLFSQAVMNIGVNLGFLPVTGVTLPLVSYGGSSVLAVMLGLGLMQSVARLGQREKAVEIR